MKLYINNTTTDSGYGTSGVDWIEVDYSSDYFLFSEGSDTVADGESIPSEIELNRAAVQLDADDPVTVSKYFLVDSSVNLLKEIYNAGNEDKQYAFACVFNAATSSEPQLEAWNSNAMEDSDATVLGSGTADDSWYKGICTTTSSPGTDWIGTPLAGSGAGNVVLLNDGNGALSAAGNLYFNFKIEIPAGYLTAGSHSPVLVITYTTN